MLLTVKERLLLERLLPAKGNAISLRVAREAGDKLTLSAKEKLDIELKFENGLMSWNPEKDLPIDVDLSIHALDMLKDELRKLEDKQDLPREYLELFEMIVEKKERQ